MGLPQSTLTDIKDGRQDFLTFVQEQGVQMVHTWVDLGRPCILDRDAFHEFLVEAGAKLGKDEEKRVWSLWCSAAWSPLGGAGDKKAAEQVADMMPFIAASCLLLTTDMEGRAEALVQAFDFDNRGGLVDAQAQMLAHSVSVGYARIMGLELSLGSHGLAMLQKACAVGLPNDAFAGDDGRIQTQQVAVALVHWLRNVSSLSVAQQRAAVLMAQIGACRYDLLPDLQVDALFLGRYRVMRRIPSDSNQFGFRRLTLAVQDEVEGCTYQAKVLVHWDSDPPQYVANFFREGALLSHVRHEGLENLVTYGRTRDYLYQVSEDLDGITLSDFLDSQRVNQSSVGVPEMDIVEMMFHLLDCLEEAHRHGVVHTAITPQNIFLVGNSFRDVRLLAWESASWRPENVFGYPCEILNSVPQEGSMLDGRSAMYASPEQCREVVDGAEFPVPEPSWDIYSLGCVAFECVCLQPPFVGMSLLQPELMVPPTDGSPAARPRRVGAIQSVGGRNFAPETIETAIRAEHCQMLPPDTRDCLTSDDLVDVIERMLCKDHEKRYKSVADLRADMKRLYAALQSLPVAMQDCLPHLRWYMDYAGDSTSDNLSGYADNRKPPSPPPASPPEAKRSARLRRAKTMVKNRKLLDLRNDKKSEFTSRYLAKFASELTVDELCVAGGVIPLHLLRDPKNTELSLHERQLSSHGMLVLARMLRGSALERLDLSSNCIAYESDQARITYPRRYELAGLKELAVTFARTPLRSLDLSANSLGAEGGAVVCRAVATCKKLHTLRLAFCEIMTLGGLALAASLPNLTELILLDLSNCHIGDDAAVALAASIASAPCLEWVSLFANSIEATGCEAVKAALDVNFTMTSLAIGENKVPENVAKHLQRALTFNVEYRAVKEKHDRYVGFGHNLMAEALKEWAKADDFVACRLQGRLRWPRDELERQVQSLLISSGLLVINAPIQSSRNNGLANQAIVEPIM